MSERDLELFEALAGDLLSTLGYERSTSAISPAIAKLAERCQNWWESEIAQREDHTRQQPDPAVVRTTGHGQEDHPIRPSKLVNKNMALSPDDAALARRDPALLGLATALDPEALVTELRLHLPEADLGTARSTYIRYKPGTSCLIAYELELAGGVLPVYVKAYGPQTEIKLHNARRRPNSTGLLGTRLVVLDHLSMAVFIFPYDAKVTALPILADPQTRRSLLRQLLPDYPDLWKSRAYKLAYKPERRYVAQLLSKSGGRAIIKLYSEAAYKEVRVRAEALESRSSLRIARNLGYSDYRNILVSEWLPGRLLSESIMAAEPNLSAVANVGAALSGLHSQTNDRLPSLTSQAEAVRLLEVAGSLGVICPELSREAYDYAQRVATQLFLATPQNNPIHGDFHAEQVLLNGDIVTLLDFDEAVLSDPAADLGNFIAHLYRQAVKGDLSPHRVIPIRDALLDGYRLAAHRPIPDRIDLYTAVSLLRLAQDPFRYREPNWSERIHVILEHVRTLLETMPIQTP